MHAHLSLGPVHGLGDTRIHERLLFPWGLNPITKATSACMCTCTCAPQHEWGRKGKGEPVHPHPYGEYNVQLPCSAPLLLRWKGKSAPLALTHFRQHREGRQHITLMVNSQQSFSTSQKLIGTPNGVAYRWPGRMSIYCPVCVVRNETCKRVWRKALTSLIPDAF